MGVLTPVRDLLRVSPEAGEAIGRLRMRGQECDLDPRDVAAFAETLEHASVLQLAIALEVITGLGLDGGGAAFEPSPQPRRRRLLERFRARFARRLDGGHDASTRFGNRLVRRAGRTHRDLGHPIARIHRMRVGVDEPGGYEPAAAVLLVRDITKEIERFLTFTPAPGDVLFVVADDRRFLDHACLRAREEAADIVEAPHLLTTVLPPTTTLVTSRAEHPNIR